MDRIEFDPVAGPPDAPHPGIRIRINGVDLIDLLRVHERPFATAEGAAQVAGGYAPLPATAAFIPPSRHFMGEAADPIYQYGQKVALLECACGAPGCWPFLGAIAVTGDSVIWSAFEQPHRRGALGQPEWDYRGFGPFTFDLRQYSDALHSLRA